MNNKSYKGNYRVRTVFFYICNFTSHHLLPSRGMFLSDIYKAKGHGYKAAIRLFFRKYINFFSIHVLPPNIKGNRRWGQSLKRIFPIFLLSLLTTSIMVERVVSRGFYNMIENENKSESYIQHRIPSFYRIPSMSHSLSSVSCGRFCC